MKLSTRILAASFIPYLIITLTHYFLTEKTFSSHLNQLYLSQAETKLIKIEANIQKLITHSEGQLKLLANIYPPTEQLPQQSQIAMSHLLQEEESFFCISALNKKGKEWLRVSKFPTTDDNQDHKTFSNSPIYQHPMLNLATYIGTVEYDKNFPLPFINLSVPVKIHNTGEPSGILWAQISLQDIQYLLEQNIPTKGKLILIDAKNGKPLVQADATTNSFLALEQESIQNILKSPKLKGFFQNSQQDLSATFLYRKFSVKSLDFMLLYYQPNDQIYYLANSLSDYTRTLFIVGLVLFFITNLLLFKKIFSPLTEVTNNLSTLKEQYRINNNNSPHKKQLPQGDEINQLHLSFVSFREQLSAYRSQIEAFNKTLEKKVAERTKELKNTQAMLLHSEKLAAIGKLSASIAHEINNPLYGIQSIIEGIKLNASLDREELELTELALSECARVKKLISDLQTFNRPSSEIKTLTDLHQLLNNITQLSKKSFTENNITVQKEYAVNLPKIQTVQDQITQVFLNLLNNAKDSLENRGGTITIKTEVKNRKIAIHIVDTGCGIEPSNLDKIFEPFYTTKPEVKGTGLGLSVTYGIIKSHAGAIKVESTPDVGTTFSVIFPLPSQLPAHTKELQCSTVI